MGRTPGHGNWSEENENQFMHILCQRMRKNPDADPSLRNADWEEMDNELYATVGVRYGTERLKGKYSRLSTNFRYFLELLETTGVTWNPETNTVHASDELWQALIKQNKEFRKFRKKGCKHYDSLRQIFPNIVAGHSHHFSLQLAANSDVKQNLEGQFLDRGFHIGENKVAGGSSMGHKAHMVAFDAAGDHQPKKKVKMQKFDEALHAWVAELDARTMDRATESQISKDFAEASELYPVERAMDILGSMVGISTAAYMKAVDKFTNPDWRKIFVKMSSAKRREWLKTLE